MKAVLRRAGRRPLHSDHGRALRSAAAVSLAVALLCTVWIATAWPDGANAALIAGAVGAVLASNDATPAVARKLLLGALLATLLCTAYDFAILPRVTDYVTLVAVLAPAFLLMGGMMSWRATAPYATGVMLTLPIAVGLTDRFAPGGFDAFVNGNMALLFGMAVPVVSLSILAPVSASGRARRLLAATRRELARRCLGRGHPLTEHWLATMLDREAYLYPHVARGETSPEALGEVLRDSRIGINIDKLRLLRSDPNRAGGAGEVDAILHGIRDHLRGAPMPEGGALLDGIDGALFGRADADRRLLHPLVGLRRSLFPDAPPPALRPERVA